MADVPLHGEATRFGSGAAPQGSRRQIHATRWVSIGSVLALLALWTVLTNAKVIKPLFLPSPQTMLGDAWSFVRDGYQGKPFWLMVGASAFRSTSGLVIGVLLGIPTGLSIGYYPLVAAALGPVFSFLRPIPAIAFIPLVILYFGIGELSKVVVIASTAFLYMVLNATAGVRSVPKVLILAAQNLGATRRQLFTEVIVPAAMPAIIAGLKTATALSWAVVVAAELIAAQSGLGYMIMDAATFFRIPYVYLGIAIIGLIGVGLEAVVGAIERRVLHWQGR